MQIKISHDGERTIILRLLCFYGLIYIAEAFFLPYITTYYSSQGMTPLKIGILSSIGPICAILVQPFWAARSDRSGKGILILRIVIPATMISVMLFPLSNNFSALLLINTVFFSFQTCIVPLGIAMTVSSLENTGYSFSSVRIGGTLGYAIAAAASGSLIQSDHRWSFVLTGAAYLLLFLLTLTLHDKPRVITKTAVSRQQSARHLLFKPRILFVLVLACATQIVGSCYSSFLGPYMMESEFHEADIGRAMMISALGELPVFLLMDRIRKQTSTFIVLLIASGILGIRTLLPSVTADFGVIAVAQFLGGVAYMLVYYNCVIFLGSETLEHLRSRAQSALVVVQVGIGSIVGNIGGGFLVGKKGIALTYQIFSGALLVLVMGMAIIYIFLIRKRTDQETDRN